MFPDLARDDVFRLETRRLWLRWPRVSRTPPTISALCSRLGSRPLTARIPHPYPPGSGGTLHLRGARGQRLAGAILRWCSTAEEAEAASAVGTIGLEARRTAA